MRLIILRHGEKDKGYYLNDIGYKRSEKLVDYIPAKFGIPDFIIAKSPVFPNYSFRPIQTIYQLGYKHNRPILVIKTIDELVKYLEKYNYTDYIFVICWEHTEIPLILRRLGYNMILSWSSNPYKYPDDDDDYNTIIEVNNRIIIHHDNIL
jgi:hypothetical protein